MAEFPIPVSTYRIQFNPQFGFAQAGSIVSYLHELGIGDLYASPLLTAVRGSAHGYDVADSTRLNPELGGEEGLNDLVGCLRQRGMGLILDIVPNHMAASPENPWWFDVLRLGRDSAYWSYFDIDWRPAGRPALAGKVMLPILGKPYFEVLENGELSLSLEENGLSVRYYDRRLPLCPRSYVEILGNLLKRTTDTLGSDHPGLAALTELVGMSDGLERLDVFRRVNEMLWVLFGTHPEMRRVLDEYLRAANGSKGDPSSFGNLDRILNRQSYRLCYWRLANREINYRRFFDVSDMVSMRVEKQEVFEATHDLILRLAGSGRIDGLRIDHIDGLHDPLEYLVRLKNGLEPEGAGSCSNSGPNSGPFNAGYIVVEKILGEGEELPGDWPVCGTTGYEFLRLVNGLFVDQKGLEALSRGYAQMEKADSSFDELVYRKKLRVMTELFAGEVRALVQALRALADQCRYGRDLTLVELERAFVEVTACLPVYRTYVRDFELRPQDRVRIENATENAIRRRPLARAACEFLRRVLLLDFPADLVPEQRREWLSFVMRWQQFSGPIMAKGFEDTALYVYNRLISANDVGGEPQAPAITIEEFHSRNLDHQRHWPHTMNTTSTHDTKRGEDVRARINVLSEIPELWAERVELWRDGNRGKKRLLNGNPVPDAGVEWFIYQTLVGAWPFETGEILTFVERLRDYLVKAAREAKIFTGWLDPDADYEQALTDFATSILKSGEADPFLNDFLRFQRLVSYYGALNSLAQTLLKITCPGVPDFYQGTELWNLSLVDPDNRRPVDFEMRTRMLRELKEIGEGDDIEGGAIQSLLRHLVSSWEDGRVKLYLTYRALSFRGANRELFTSGGYIPLKAAGHLAEHVCAFARRFEDNWVIVAVPRLLARLRLGGAAVPGETQSVLGVGDVFGHTRTQGTVLVLPESAPHRWRDVISQQVLDVRMSEWSEPAAQSMTDAEAVQPRNVPSLFLSELFESFPVALLVSE